MHSSLECLEQPESFYGWLRASVRHYCYRIRRSRRYEVPLDQVAEIAADRSDVIREIDREKRGNSALCAVRGLPRALREVVALRFIEEFSQHDIALFLGIPVTTVNNRLHAARGLLKRRLMATVRGAISRYALEDDFAGRIGEIIRVRGPIFNVQFRSQDLPAVLSSLTVLGGPAKVQMTVEVVQHLRGSVVRCLPVLVDLPEPDVSMLCGRKAVNPSPPAQGGISREVVNTAAAVVRRPLKRPLQLVETGIKVIDLLCPLVRGGTVGLFGIHGVGKLVLLEELVRNIAVQDGDISFFTFVRIEDKTAVQDVYAKEPGYVAPAAAPVQSMFISSDVAAASDGTDDFSFLDAVLSFSPVLAKHAIFPAVDPLASHSRFLCSGIVGADSYEIAARVRKMLLEVQQVSAKDPAVWTEQEHLLVGRSRRLQLFFSQPFFVAEPCSHRPGRRVTLEQTVHGCRAILEGKLDDVPEETFWYIGAIE